MFAPHAYLNEGQVLTCIFWTRNGRKVSGNGQSR
jgi:hypothetical protein